MPTRIFPKRRPRLYLAEWREHVGLTQKQVGGRLGTSDVTISRWETGERLPDLNAQAAFAEALGVHLEDLYRHPSQESADALLRGQPSDVREQAIKVIKALRR